MSCLGHEKWLDRHFSAEGALGRVIQMSQEDFEVHCGSNVVRPSADALWWEDATHLLTEED